MTLALRQAHVGRGPKIALLGLIAGWMFEGAARKWLFPAQQQYLFFLRDPFILAIYAFASRRYRPRTPWLLAIIFLWLLPLTMQAVIVSEGGESVTSAAYGLREYVFPIFVPFALLRLSNKSHVISALRMIIWASMPLALLSVAQASTPTSSWFNRLPTADAIQLVSANGVVRPTTTFTSSAGNSYYVMLCVAALLILFKTRNAGRWLPFFAVPAVTILTVTSGSRLVIFGIGAAAIPTLLSQLLDKPSRALYFVAVPPAVLAVLLYTVGPTLAPITSAFTSRISMANHEENTSGRVVEGLTNFGPYLLQAATLGSGMGSATQGTHALGTGGAVEDELSRWVVELGYVVFPFALAVRWLFCGYLSTSVLRRARYRSDLVFMWGITIPVFLFGQLTAQGSVNGFGWISCSLLLVLLADQAKHSDDGAKRQHQQQPPV